MNVHSRSPLTLVLVPLTFLVVTMPAPASAQSKDRALEHARQLLQSSPLIDRRPIDHPGFGPIDHPDFREPSRSRPLQGAPRCC